MLVNKFIIKFVIIINKIQQFIRKVQFNSFIYVLAPRHTIYKIIKIIDKTQCNLSTVFEIGDVFHDCKKVKTSIFTYKCLHRKQPFYFQISLHIRL